MTAKKLLLLILLCIGLHFTSSAQYDDYFITLKDDTVKCSLSEDFLTSQLLYQKDKSNPHLVLRKSLLSEYCFHKNDMPFMWMELPGSISVTLKKEFFLIKNDILKNYIANSTIPRSSFEYEQDSLKTFVQRLTAGQINIYKYRMTHNLVSGSRSSSASYANYYFASRNSGPLVLIYIPSITKAIKHGDPDQFIDMISDMPELMTYFKNIDAFDYDVITAIIKRYNDGKIKKP